MKLSTAEHFLDNHPSLNPLPINSRRIEESYTSGHETPRGRHLILDRQGVRLFVENSFDPSSIVLSSSESRYEHYGPDRKRADVGRASVRLAGPKNGRKGADTVCFKLDNVKDLQAVVDA